ncbi:dynein regulatory complex protein 1-like [Parus major]|uniref:dynein regulatory complex protein 1-like n=1 Tax=Parus major TaxID=9157 RepID=UPI001443C4AF|nr:dynein regulatory complex protein 1-like [Parus major]
MEQGESGAVPGPQLEPTEPEPHPEPNPEPHPDPEPDPGADPDPDPGADPDPGTDPCPDPCPGADPGPDPGPGADPGPEPESGADLERQQRIAARRNRLDARRREALGEKVEQQEEEEEKEEERKSLKLIQETGKVLAKLLFHGTQLVTNVQVESDLREWRRREKEGPEKLRRLEKLETEAKRGAEKLSEINSRWGSAEELKVPQELWELLEQQQEQCQQLLAEKNRLIQELRQELQARDERYEQALKEQAEEIRLLLERMEEQTRNMLRTYRHHLRQIEKTFEEERREMLANNRKRWNEAIQAHNEQELEFLRQRMERAREFEQQLNELQAESVESYDRMKSQLEQDVQYLEKKLRQMKGMFHLNQVKLEYNLDVLRQLDLENSTLRSLQKRKITRFQTCLSLLRERMVRQEEKFQEEKRSLEWELQRVTGQFQETRSRMRQLSQSSAERFRQVWIVNEEEAKALIREALDADRIIHVQQLGIPWEEPPLGFLENVGPLGGRREKRDALQVATELLEGIKSGKREREGRRSRKKGGEGRKEKQENSEQRVTSQPNIPRKTLRKMLELLSEESIPGSGSIPTVSAPPGLLQPIPRLSHPWIFPALPPLSRISRGAPPAPRKFLTEFPLFQTLRIEDEDDLRKLLDYFLDFDSQKATKRQDIPGGEDPTDPAQERGNVGSHSQRDELRSPGNSIRADDILGILKEFLRDFAKLRDEGPPREIQDVRDNSKDGEYWESLSAVIPEPTLKLWDALGAALREYHKVLTRRSELFSEAAALQRQNSELGILLEEYLGSAGGR